MCSAPSAASMSPASIRSCIRAVASSTKGVNHCLDVHVLSLGHARYRLAGLEFGEEFVLSDPENIRRNVQ